MGDLGLQSHPKDVCINPLIAPACKLSGLKKMLTRAPANSIVMDKANFNTVHFDRSPFMCTCEGGGGGGGGAEEASIVSSLALLLVLFLVTARKAWQRKR